MTNSLVGYEIIIRLYVLIGLIRSYKISISFVRNNLFFFINVRCPSPTYANGHISATGDPARIIFMLNI